MVQSYRPQKVANEVRQIISYAIANQLNDPRVAPLTTVTQVTMSRDLQVATVLISVAGPEVDERKTLRALLHARSHLRRLVGERLQLRQVPELRISIDESVRKVRETLRLIASNAPQPEDSGESMDAEEGRADDDTPLADEPANSSPTRGDATPPTNSDTTPLAEDSAS